MKVKNYIVENKELFIDFLEKELCQQGIFYVKIDNEIHFEDQIIRFYDFEKDYQKIRKWYFRKQLEDCFYIIEEGFSKEIVKKIRDSFLTLEKENSFVLSQLEQYSYLEKILYKRNRSTLKKESIEVNQKLKRYSRKRKI